MQFKKGLVVLSGGQDSMTCLGIALQECDEVMAISFYYGQKHIVELAAASKLCRIKKVPHIEIDLSFILKHMRSSALVMHGDTTLPHPILQNLPASFVPARNALFLTSAYGLAIERGCDVIYAGVCQTDYSGYPDCRDEFVTALNDALNIGYESSILIRTPLMFLTKAETFKLAEDVGILDDVIEYSVTCYEGNTDRVHPWGRGCGDCPACKLRAKGFEEYVRNYHAA